MLRTEKLQYTYPQQTAIEYPDMACLAGEELLILGESGSGKTTLLHLLGGILPVQSGKVYIEEKDISEFSKQALDSFRGQKIGIVFQDAHFLKSLTVKENIALAQRLAGQKVNHAEIREVLVQLNIESKLDKYPNELSRGEKQRASIAQAIINKPAMILADEPTSALDDKNCTEVLQLLKNTAKLVNASLIIVTHDNRLMEHFSRKVVLN